MLMYPELILVNGEDLTNYRRFSRAVTRLVKSIVWDRKVERLGMDELFCDVTDMVNAHQKELDQAAAKSSSADRIFFNLSQEGIPPGSGFYYDLATNPSLVLPQASVSQDSEYSRQLLSAAHLASYIRQRIHTELGFTTSAGIAHNKIIGKLVASLNKPALQTTWNPDVRRWREEQAAFIGGFEIRK
jgi:DNA polymerase iota